MMDHYPPRIKFCLFNPQRKEALALTELIIDLPTTTPGETVNDHLIDEHHFKITTNEPWYIDIADYLKTHKFSPSPVS